MKTASEIFTVLSQFASPATYFPGSAVVVVVSAGAVSVVVDSVVVVSVVVVVDSVVG